MNHNFKFNVVALLATLSGCALGTCHAKQVDEGSTNTFGSGVVRSAEPAYDPAFGTVKVARPLNDHANAGYLPPIVSPENAIDDTVEQQPIVLPPIVRPIQASKQGAPAPHSQGAGENATDQRSFAAPEQQRQAPTNMLAPLVPSERPMVSADHETRSAYAPAPIIQATRLPFDSHSGSNVDHAAQWSSQELHSQGVSAAGIPLYPKAVPAGFIRQNEPIPPIVQPTSHDPTVMRATSSIPMAPVISPDSEIVFPSSSLSATGPMRMSLPPIVNNQSPFMKTSAPLGLSSAPMTMSLPQVPMASNPVVPMDSVMVDPRLLNQDQTYFGNPPMDATVMNPGNSMCIGCGGGGCPECGRTGYAMGDVAGCQSCGPGGCFNGDDVTSQFNSCGSVSWARRYLIVDAFYIQRYDGTVAISNFGGLNKFEDDLYGAKLTFGRREDATNGREFVYFGTAKMAQSALHTDPLGRISLGGFPAAGTVFAPETTAFRNATEQAQTKQTMFQSVEFNKNDWGWDVMRTFWGARYVYVQDEYAIASRNLAGETGLFELTTLNNMFGPQVGYELFYDVGYRLSGSTMGKFGLLVNPNVVKTKLFNAGAQFLDLTDENTTLGGLIELGIEAKYKITKSSRFKIGYNAFYLDRVAGVSDNVPVVLSATTGSDTSDSGQMFFHGVSLGFEIFK